jgi:hypothetical protein
VQSPLTDSMIRFGTYFSDRQHKLYGGNSATCIHWSRRRGQGFTSEPTDHPLSLRDREPTNGSIPPEVLEPRWRQLAVANSVLDVLVAEVGLQRPGVDTVVGQLEPTGMTQHVRVYLYL